VKLNLESLFLVSFPSRNVFYGKCGENDVSVATFVANSFLMLDTAGVDEYVLHFTFLKYLRSFDPTKVSATQMDCIAVNVNWFYLVLK